MLASYFNNLRIHFHLCSLILAELINSKSLLNLLRYSALRYSSAPLHRIKTKVNLKSEYAGSHSRGSL